jgi:CheY-like chemotaxis protein
MAVVQDKSHPRRILLVEDDNDSLEVTRRLLERDGHLVATATCLKNAIDTAGAGFDVLIADIGLPDGTGIELIQRLKIDGPVKGIALSGFGMRADVESCRAAGFMEHLTKPIKFDDLRSAIDRVCSGVLIRTPVAAASGTAALPAVGNRPGVSPHRH